MSPAEENVTLGELSRALGALERRMEQGFEHINHRFDRMQFVPREVYEVQARQLIERLDALEEAKKWTVRTLVASFAFPMLVAVLVAVVVTR